jgi:hypothetical protein
MSAIPSASADSESSKPASRPLSAVTWTAVVSLSLVPLLLSQSGYALGWRNAWLSDDWWFVYAVSQVHSPAQLLSLLSLV